MDLSKTVKHLSQGPIVKGNRLCDAPVNKINFLKVSYMLHKMNMDENKNVRNSKNPISISQNSCERLQRRNQALKKFAISFILTLEISLDFFRIQCRSRRWCPKSNCLWAKSNTRTLTRPRRRRNHFSTTASKIQVSFNSHQTDP